MDNLKRSAKRLVTRLTILGVVVVCGAIAIAQAQREMHTADDNQPELEQPQRLADTSDGLTANSDSAVQDLGATQTWAAPGPRAGANPPAAETPAAPMRLIHDDQVQPAQAELDSGFSVEQDSYAQAERRPNPYRNSMDRQFSDPVPPDSSDREPTPAVTLEAPPLLEEDVVVAEPHNGAGGLPLPLDQGRFGGDVDAGSANEFYQQPDDAAGRFGSPPITEDAPPSDRFGGGTEPPNFEGNFNEQGVPEQQFAEPVDEPRFSNNPMRSGSEDLPLPTQRGPLTEDEPVLDDEPRAADPQPEFNDPGLDGRGDYPAAIDQNDGTLAGTGQPGPKELEGPQSPSLTVRKIAPSDVRVGQPATFQVKVRNVGPVSADRVLIRDEVPQGATLIDTSPQATTTAEGGVLWQVGTLRPGDEVTVSMQVKPSQEGPLGSVATLTFQASASAQAVATKPMLEIEHSAPTQVLLGERLNFTILLTNPGSGPATHVVLEEDVPEGLSHAQGPKLEYEVGTIPPGATRRLELTLKAAKPGPVKNIIMARAEGGLSAEHQINLEVIAPELGVKVTGPARRYLERNTTFALAIENRGTAAAQNVELVTRLPQGLKFVSTNNSGRYDPSSQTIRWSLDRLPAGEFGEVKFTAIPMAMGDYNIHAEATADSDLRDQQDHQMKVEGIAALLFVVVDQVDPIEVGGITTYEIRVKNQGTKDATNIAFAAAVPPGMKAVGGEGPTDVRVEGERIFCDAIARLPAKAELTYQIRVQGVEAGDQRFRVQMTSDDTERPVVKEESTQVYSD